MNIFSAKFIAYTVLIISTYHIQFAESVDCFKKTYHDEGRLKKFLLCGSYDANQRPVKDMKFAVNVSIVPMLMGYEYQWIDENLKWDPKDYNNQSSIAINSEQIWNPDFQLYSSTAKFDTKQSCTNLRCLVKSDGTVIAVPSCDFSARCEADYTDWPLDTQSCRMLFGAWMEHAGEVDYQTRFACLGSEQSNMHTQWRVVSAKNSKKEATFNNATYPTLIYDYILERHSGFHLAGMLTPILLLIVMNLFLTWLKTDSIERKLLLAVSIICHFYFMVFIQWAVPKNGDTVPGILLFYRSSVIITAILLIHTLIGTAIKGLQGSPPALVTLVAGSVIQNKIGELVLARDYMTVEYKKSKIAQPDGNEHAENQKTWKSLSRIMDRILFLVFLALYAVSFIIYIPLKYTSRFGAYELHILSYKDINQF
ncbi:neuronal acetylcholine receptor subunit alpha-5-like isoform X2 [Armigeres subalbatus]|uniref:neuronal acetylcholine receptor subunit alpha-5-like isoform X2 n=1 Tax=Armigeres subalbatus TaxID=124917 RepID=UPI002ED1C445